MSDGRQWRKVHGVRSESMAEVHRRIAEDEASRPSSTPPARDSGRDEAREAVARWLYRKTGLNEDDLSGLADELLALPEVAAILTEPRQPPHSSR